MGQPYTVKVWHRRTEWRITSLRSFVSGRRVCAHTHTHIWLLTSVAALKAQPTDEERHIINNYVCSWLSFECPGGGDLLWYWLSYWLIVYLLHMLTSVQALISTSTSACLSFLCTKQKQSALWRRYTLTHPAQSVIDYCWPHTFIWAKWKQGWNGAGMRKEQHWEMHEGGWG